MRNVRTPLVVLLGLLGLLLADAAAAGQYEIIEGKGEALCEVCQKNLERMTAHPGCERVYSPKLGLGSPAWKKLDAYKHIDLYKRAIKYLGERDEFAKDTNVDDDKEFRKVFDPAIQAGFEMHLVQIDFDNDGTLEQVFKFGNTRCLQRDTYGTEMVVFSSDLGEIRKGVTDQVKQTYIDDVRPNQTYGVFTYGGKTYFDKWDQYLSGGSIFYPDRLTIYKIESDKTEWLCEIKAVERR